MQQKATETSEGRLCRHDKIILSILIANFFIMLIWSLSLNLSASSAENTEKEEVANSQIMQTENIKRFLSVELKGFTVSTTETTTITTTTTTTTETTTTIETETTTITSSDTTTSESTTTTTLAETQPIETIVVTESVVQVADESTVPEEITSQEIESDTISEEPKSQEEKPAYTGPVLTPRAGVVQGPSGKETYYNLNMGGVISNMNALGYHEEYWIREDGCKMFGPYIMCAANLNVRPRGTIVQTSLGEAIVCDTGGFAANNIYQLDIAVTW